MEKPKYDKYGRRQDQYIDRKIRQVLRARGDDCGICGGPIDYAAGQYDPGAPEMDHIIPISRGGEKTLENTRMTHRRCNRSRSNMIDADAIAAGAQPAPSMPETTRTTTCPPGPCQRCRGTHHPRAGVGFETMRSW